MSEVSLHDETTDYTNDTTAGSVSGTPPVQPLEEDGPELSNVSGVNAMGADYSLLDTFKQELQELVETTDVFIPIKGYDKTGLTVKYHLPGSGKELDAISRKVMREVKDNFTRNLLIGMDTMIYLCNGLYVQPQGVDEPVTLDPDESGIPVDYGDSRLAELIGLSINPPPAARTILKRLFGSNDMAVLNHAERLNRWIQDTKADLNAELWQLGE